MNQSCLCTMLYLGSTLIALCQAECIASYSVEVTVKSSCSSTRKATVISASLPTMQPCSMESSGNFDSKVVILLLFFGQRPQQYVSFLHFLWLKVTDKVADCTAVHKVAWGHIHYFFWEEVVRMLK